MKSHNHPPHEPPCAEHAVGRCLIVIDPEDRQQVERVLIAMTEWAGRVPYSDMREPGDLTQLDAAQAALRSLVAPPRPEEPPAWSVVVVVDSTPFTRVARDHMTPPYQTCWFGEHPLTGEHARLTWGELHALGEVRVVGRGIGDEVTQ